MGQYHLIVNLDRREYIDPGAFGVGLKAWEQLANFPSTPQALFALLLCANGRGGGDLAGHGFAGRWAGDRIAVVGDYATDTDLALEHHAGGIYAACRAGRFRDISADIRPLIAVELGVTYVNAPVRFTDLDGKSDTLDSWRVIRDPDAAFSVLSDPEDAS